MSEMPDDPPLGCAPCHSLDRLGLEERLCAVRAALAEHERSRQRLEHARRQAAALHARIARLATSAAREQHDVEALAGLSLTALLERCFGDLAGRRREELLESLGAQLRLDQARADRRATEADIAALEQRLARQGDPRDEYLALLAEKDRRLAQDPTDERALADHLVEREGLLRDALRELDEAEWAGQVAKGAITGLLHALTAAQALGRLDLVGMASSWGKLGPLEDAHRHASAAQRALSRFQRELADVDSRHDARLEVRFGALERFADAIVDDLLSDWIVLCRIERSHTSAGIANARVQRSLRGLVQRRALMAQELENVRARRLGLHPRGGDRYPGA